jgi:hypothetical protein
MTKVIFTQATAQSLVGKTIIEVGLNYIRLDNGLRIYLESSEIDDLNQGLDTENLAEKEYFRSHPELNP